MSFSFNFDFDHFLFAFKFWIKSGLPFFVAHHHETSKLIRNQLVFLATQIVVNKRMLNLFKYMVFPSARLNLSTIQPWGFLTTLII
jgi:hypothetical protein